MKYEATALLQTIKKSHLSWNIMKLNFCCKVLGSKYGQNYPDDNGNFPRLQFYNKCWIIAVMKKKWDCESGLSCINLNLSCSWKEDYYRGISFWWRMVDY